MNVLWGKLASEILVQNWETALEDVNKLREYIDSNVIGNSLQILQQRTWLIHWSLFVFFNHVKGRDLIIEMFLYRPQYVQRKKKRNVLLLNENWLMKEANKCLKYFVTVI